MTKLIIMNKKILLRNVMIVLHNYFINIKVKNYIILNQIKYMSVMIHLIIILY